jgi:hypothetical protein
MKSIYKDKDYLTTLEEDSGIQFSRKESIKRAQDALILTSSDREGESEADKFFTLEDEVSSKRSTD